MGSKTPISGLQGNKEGRRETDYPWMKDPYAPSKPTYFIPPTNFSITS